MYIIEVGKTLPYETAAIYAEAYKDATEHNLVVVDMTRTNYIHSSFIGFLLNLIAQKKKNGGSVEFKFSDQSHVRDQLDRIGVMSYLRGI